ncbi:hypothetical protein CANARDRAFT_29997 [[Candida] arabinofermentans NRRL YB-2248]|uniref:Uncharacterized protein n=1 Tax=[Candida] arabinofermentans NRRL YB-2248 TaxID=983967 RepID=A0A1E4SV19_9ASCO|nr:hypothetical protein CANARDRAFT_29997 [[Candida] arabinofermentans NRRL YB-2248]
MDITTNEATPEGEQSSTVNSTNVALSEEPVEEPVEEKEKVDLEERLEVTPSFDAVSASTVLDTATTEEQNSEDPVVASYKPSFSNIASSFASSVLMDLDASEVEEGDPNVDESKEESLSTSKSEEDVYEEQSINEPKLEEKIDIVVNSIPSNEELNAVDDEDLVTRISVGPTEKDAAVIDSASDDVIDETISISVQPEETSTVPPGLLSYLLAKASHSRQSDGAKETIDDKLPQNESETEETEMIHVKSDDAEAEIDENASDSSVIYKQNDLLQAPDSLGKIPALQLQQSESSDSDDESEQEIANNALVKTDSSPARRTRSQIAENALPEAKKRSLEDLEEDLDLQNHREVRKGSNKRINSDSFDLGRKGRTKSPVRKDKSYRAPSPIKITGSGISTRSGRVLSYEFDEAQLNLEENTISVPAQPDDRADDTKDIELETLPKSVQELVAEGEQFIEVEEEFEAKKEHEHELELYEEEIEEREQMGDENINEHEKSVAHITVKPETNEKQGSVQENDEKLKVESTIQEPIEQITVKKRGSRIKAPSNAKTSFRAKMRETSTESELPLSETEGPRTRRKRVVSERSRNRLENERVPSERATRSSKAVESDEPKQEDEPATKRKRARERERVGRPPKRRGRSSK